MKSGVSTADELIMKSCAASNLEGINSCSKNPKSLWTTIQCIVHLSTPAEQLPPAVSKPLADSLASFFREKIISLKSPYPPNSVALHLFLLLTNPTLDRNSMTAEVTTRCLTNRHRLTMFQHLCSSHAPAHSRFSYLTLPTCQDDCPRSRHLLTRLL